MIKNIKLTVDQVKEFARIRGYTYNDKGSSENDKFFEKGGRKYRIRQMFAITYSEIERGKFDPYVEFKDHPVSSYAAHKKIKTATFGEVLADKKVVIKGKILEINNEKTERDDGCL